MNTLDLVGLQAARSDGSSEPFQWVDSTLPPIRGLWTGQASDGMFRGHDGMFNLNLIRDKEGYVEFPRSLRRERRWFRYVREDVSPAGFVLWVTDNRKPPSRLVCRWVDAQVLTIHNDYGGSAVANVQSEGLLNDTLYGTETGLTLR
jgi:hypothetical protein